jgi:ATP:ADP antiporter, AAA family
MVDLRPGEAPAMLWAAAMFCAVLASYFVLRPVRDALALDGDLAFLPVLFTATFGAMLVATHLWGSAVSRWPRRRFVPILYRVFIATVVVFFALVRGGFAPAAVGYAFYVWTSVFNLLLVSVFWSLVADLLAPEQARRLYGPIAAGGTVGALLGPILTRALVGWIGVPGVLLLSAALLEVAVQCSRRLERASAGFVGGGARLDEPARGAALAGLGQVARSRYLAGIALYVLCTVTVATFIYFEQAALVKVELADRDARTAYFAGLDAWTNGITLFLQTFVTTRLLGWLGAAAVLAILPVVQGVGLTALAIAPTLGVLAIVQVAGRSITHGIARPARELLFTVVARAEKYKAKSVIDTLVFRFGDVASSWLRQGLIALGLAGAGLVGAATPFTAVWLTTAIGLGLAYRRRAHDSDPGRRSA